MMQIGMSVKIQNRNIKQCMSYWDDIMSSLKRIYTVCIGIWFGLQVWKFKFALICILFEPKKKKKKKKKNNNKTLAYTHKKDRRIAKIWLAQRCQNLQIESNLSFIYEGCPSKLCSIIIL